jgi:hypothetical protein
MSFLPFMSLVLDCPMDIMMNLTSCSSEKLLLVFVGTLTLAPHFRDLIRDIIGTYLTSGSILDYAKPQCPSTDSAPSC